MPESPILEGRNVSKHFSLGRRNLVRAVDGVSFSLARGEIAGILGESGCGKSTLGRLALGLIRPNAGAIYFRGEDISVFYEKKLFRRRLPPGNFRQAIQMVFQNPFASFNPRMRLYDALMEVCLYYGMDRAGAEEKILGILETTGLGTDTLFRWPSELSGGQLQRLAIARALLPGPDVIVADEPLSALDVSVQAQLLNLLAELRKRLGTAMIFISHDITAVEHLCDTTAVMYMGRIVERASTGELFSHTLHPYTEALIAAAPRLEPDSSSPRFLLEGDPPRPGETVRGCPFAPRCRRRMAHCENEAPLLEEKQPGHFVACHWTPRKP